MSRPAGRKRCVPSPASTYRLLIHLAGITPSETRPKVLFWLMAVATSPTSIVYS